MDRKKDNILNQLKKSGPGFTVPKAYFKDSKDQVNPSSESIKSRWNKNEETKLNNVKETNFFTLDKTVKGHGFKVPKDYFETIDSNVSSRKKSKVIPLKHKFARVLSLSIAASILLFYGINSMKTSQNINEQFIFQDEEFTNWIESDLVDFDSYEIAEAFNDVDLEYDLYADEDIDEYLNNVDIENLILENR